MNKTTAKQVWFDTPRPCELVSTKVSGGRSVKIIGKYYGLPTNAALAHQKIIRLAVNSIINGTIRSKAFRRRLDKIKNFHAVLGDLRIEWLG